jgi:hypothetical protein
MFSPVQQPPVVHLPGSQQVSPRQHSCGGVQQPPSTRQTAVSEAQQSPLISLQRVERQQPPTPQQINPSAVEQHSSGSTGQTLN